MTSPPILLALTLVLTVTSCTLGEYDFVNNKDKYKPSTQPDSKPQPEPEQDPFFVPTIKIDVEDGMSASV